MDFCQYPTGSMMLHDYFYFTVTMSSTCNKTGNWLMKQKVFF